MFESIEVLAAPAELNALSQRDLGNTVCVVFDVLRATSVIVTALANGAVAVAPVLEIAEALARRKKQPEVLLAGEREGVRIRGNLTGGADFDLGNSPCEFTAAVVSGRTIIITTTNGTRALQACSGAQAVLIGSFLNLGATARHLKQSRSRHLLLVCSGTRNHAALEDILGAGALCDLMGPADGGSQMLDSAWVALELYRRFQPDLCGAMGLSLNGRRLLGNPDLRDDVPFCFQRDVFDLVAGLGKDGFIRKQD